MSIQRIFLDFDRPALVSATAYFARQYRQGDRLDLSNLVIITPTRRLGRRLIELLVETAREQELQLLPPEIDTIGYLPERLYHPRLPLASELVQQLAWAKALRLMPPEKLTPLIPEPPPASDLPRWRDLGELVRRQHIDLAADGLNFESVVRMGAEIEGFDEIARWQTLHAVQMKYHELLDAEEIWDAQSARLYANEHKECSTEKDIVLLAISDINISTREMLDQVSDHVTTLIFGLPEWEGCFDELGCLKPEAWETRRLPIHDHQIHVAENAAEQAAEVGRIIASFEGKYTASEITIGVPDAEIVGQVVRQLQQCNIEARFDPGRPLSELGPYRLLQGVGDYLDEGRFRDFAALVRHADIQSWLAQGGMEGDWLTEMDRYFIEHLPIKPTDRWLGKKADATNAKKVFQKVQRLTRSLRATKDAPVRKLNEWTAPLVDLMVSVYKGREFDRTNSIDRQTLNACEKIHAKLLEHQDIPPSLAPTMNAADAIRLTLHELKAERAAGSHLEEAIELVGWNELPLDDAKAIIVTSMNEPFVPKSVGADLFLPNSLRARLGIDDNARRYARDAYAVNALAGSRREVTYIVARKDSHNYPLTPSRLLFATDRETIAGRALRFFQPDTEVKPVLAGGLVATREKPNFPIPLPDMSRFKDRPLSPTAFREYIGCPYRYYLKKVLRLDTLSDDVEELDGGQFGSLVHNVLEQFGLSAVKDSEDPDEIYECLHSLLNKCVAESFGEAPLTPVAVQVEQLRIRLKIFSEKQADWAKDGWRIKHVEVPGTDHPIEFEVDGVPQLIHGYIDRIDQNERTGQFAILDYKSSDYTKPPEVAHRKNGEWIDLQLPLYRHLAASVGVTGSPLIGYILVSKDQKSIGFSMADWTESELNMADETARNVIRDIRSGVFWPPTDPPPKFSDDLAPICQDFVFDKWEEEQEEQFV